MYRARSVITAAMCSRAALRKRLDRLTEMKLHALVARQLGEVHGEDVCIAAFVVWAHQAADEIAGVT